MTRGVGFEQVKHAAITLMRQGKYPSVASVRAHIGTGSADTINAHMQDVWRQIGEGLDTALPSGIPETLLEPLVDLWTLAVREAGARFDEERSAYRARTQEAETARLEAEMSARDLVGRIETLRDQIDERDARLAATTQESAALRNEIAGLRGEIAASMEGHAKDRQRFAASLREMREKRRLDRDAYAEQIRQFEKRLDDDRERMDRQEKHWIMEVYKAREDADKVRADFEAHKVTLETQMADQRIITSQASGEAVRLRERVMYLQNEANEVASAHQKALTEKDRLLAQARTDADNARRLATEHSRETEMLRSALMAEQSRIAALESSTNNQMALILRELSRLSGADRMASHQPVDSPELNPEHFEDDDGDEDGDEDGDDD